MWFRFFLVFVFSISNAYAIRSYETEAQAVGEKNWKIDFDGSRFESSARLDIDGNETAFSNLEIFSITDYNIGINYGFGEQLEVEAGGRFRSILSETSTTISEVSGMESYYGALNYNLRSKGDWSYKLRASFRQAAYSYDVGVIDPDVVLGDQGVTTAFGIRASYFTNPTHVLTGKFDYVLPGNDLSDEIHYGIESAWPYQKYAFFIGFNGILSMEGDPYTDTPSLKPAINTGPSNLFNSINRSLVSPYIGLNRTFGKWRIGVRGSQILSGTSTDKGQEIALTFAWKSTSGVKDKRKINKFKEYYIEASVLKVSPRGKFIQIDQGYSTEVEKGMRFDIYKSNVFGKNDLVASGIAYEVESDKAIIRVTKKYKRLAIKKNFIARGY